MVLGAYDQDFKSGTFALTTDNATGSYFDELVIKPLVCHSNTYDADYRPIYIQKTNRFYERYKVDISINWFQDEKC